MNTRIFSKLGKIFAIGAVALLMFGLLISFAYATITTLTVIAPNGSEEVRGTSDIDWSTTGGAPGDLVNIVYSTDDFASQAVIAENVVYDSQPYSWDTTGFADGADYKIRFVNASALVYDTSDAVFMVDNTAPVTTATPSFPPAGTGWYNISTGVPTITLSCDDSTTGNSGCSDTFYKWDGGSYASYTGPLTPAEGEHTLSYYSEDEAVDALGDHNVETVQTLDTKVDTAAPSASVAYSKDPVKSGDILTITATFDEDMADSPVVNIEISGSNTVSATAMTKVSATEYTYTHTVGAGDGLATVAFSVGTDPAGNPITPTPTSGATFTVDNIAPTLAEVTPVPTPDNDSTPDYTFSTDEAGTIAYPGTCSSATTSATPTNNTITLNSLADGSHSGCSLNVTDAAGNTSLLLTATAFLIDTVDPVVDAGDDKELNTFIAVQDATVTDDSSGVDVTSYVWTKTSGPGTITFGTPNSQDTSITASSEGTYVIRLTASDLAGNSSYGEMTYVYDTTPPGLAEVTPVSDPTNDNTPSWEFSADHVGWLPGHTGGTIDYGGSCLPGDLATAVAGNNTTTYGLPLGLADGTYSDCNIDVMDAAGNTSSLLAVSSFEIDTIAATVLTITTEDTDPNGKVDKVTIVFDDPVDDSTFVPGDFVIDGIAATAVGTGGTPNDDTVILTFGTEVDGTEAKTLVYSSSATDLAGNDIAPFSTLATDLAKPMLISAKTVTTTSIEATFSEDLDGTTLNDTALDEFTVAGGTYTVVGASELGGVVTLTVDPMPTDATPDVTYTEMDVLNDLSGNTAVTPTTVTAVDEVAPTLTSVSIASDNAKDTELAKVGDTATLSFTASEDTATPVVTIDGMTADAVSGGPSVWTATYMFVGGETEGTIPFTIDFEDLVVPANVGTTVTAVTDASSVFYDETDPIVDAGIDREVNAPVTPQGASTSDPAPASGVDTYEWTNETPGVGTVTFSNESGFGTGVDTDLAADTDGTYTLKLTVEDEAGNSTFDEMTFIWDTTNPVAITSSPSDGTTGVSKSAGTATVTFDEIIKLTNSGKVLLVDDSTGDSYKGTVAVDGGDGTSAILNIDYSALGYGTKYRINVIPSPQGSDSLSAVTDIAGNKLVTSFTSYFTTEIDTIAPVVNSFSASSITTAGATLNVTTDEGATCSYATTDSAYASMSAFDTTGGTTHTHVLSALTPTTGYDYFVRCADTTAQTNTMTTSAHVSFTTLTPDTTGPVISNIQATSIGETSATITWDTDESATSRVEYGPTSSYGSFTAVDATADNTTHSVALSGLSDGTDYHFRVISEDAGGYETISPDNTFTTVAAPDTTKPVITILGDASVTLTVGGSYSDAGATASDDVDGDITANIATNSNVDTGTAGVYTVTYDVQDAAGNDAIQKTRVVVVNEPDATPPVISSITTDKAEYEVSDTSVQVTVVEDDTASTVTINGTSASESPAGTWEATLTHPGVVGTYSIVVITTNSDGDASTREISYNVVADPVSDDTPPVIVLLGINPQTFTEGDAYAELDATASDDVDGDISGSILIDTSAVDMGTPGTYTVTYNVSDTAGNPATEVTRTVVVEAAFDDTASLAVTAINTVANENGSVGYATDNDEFDDGWRWIFKVTVPTSETEFSMKFADFMSGGDTILAADNIRLYSAQASASSASITAETITAANTYSTAITLDSDIDASTAGRQIEVTVEMKVPVGSAGGSYSAQYGVKSEEI